MTLRYLSNIAPTDTLEAEVAEASKLSGIEVTLCKFPTPVERGEPYYSPENAAHLWSLQVRSRGDYSRWWRAFEVAQGQPLSYPVDENFDPL